MSDLSGDDLAAAMMADAPGGAEKKKSGLLPTIAAVSVLTLVAVGGGAGVGMLLGGKAQPPAAAMPAAPAPVEAAQAEPAAAAKTVKSAPVLLALPPMITNLASPPGTKIRMEASILVRTAVKDGEAAAVAPSPSLPAEVQADTLVFLRTVDLTQIEGARGLLHLREDLLERAKLRSPDVSDYLISSLVAE